MTTPDRRAAPLDDPAAVVAEAEQLAPTVASHLAAARERIVAAGGDPERVAVVGVTKTFGPAAPVAALMAGIDDLGENYAAELLEKAPIVAAAARLAGLALPRWHFLGGIQRNKIGRLFPIVHCWQALSRPEEAASIARHAAHARQPGNSPPSGGSTGPEAFIEVNVAGDPGRAGCPPREVASLVAAARNDGLVVRGLMAVAPLGGSEAASAFRSVAVLAGELGLEELSLGMSGDLEAAVAAGSTMIRLGTALFGARKPGNASQGL